MSADLCFTNGPILTLDATDPVLEDGYLTVTDGIISETGVNPRGRTLAGSARETVDLGGKLLMPGLKNAHTHAFTTLFRGLGCVPSPATLAAELGAEALQNWVYWGTKLACLEMILSGTTGFCDVSPCADAVARAADEAGLRAVAAQLVPGPGSCENDTNAVDPDSLGNDITGWAAHRRVSMAIAPDLAGGGSPASVQRCGAHAAECNVPLIVDLGEARGSASVPLWANEETPTQHLQQLGLLSPRLVCVQETRLAEEDMEALAENGVTMVYCPAHAMRVGRQDAPLPGLLAHGIPVGLGTGDCCLGDSLDLFRTMDQTAKWEAVSSRNPAGLNSRQVLGMGVGHGSRALGSETGGGTLTIGAPADLILLDLTQAHLTPIYRYVSHMVYCARGADVLSSMVAGRWLMRDRRVQGLDLNEIKEHIAPMLPAARRLALLSVGDRSAPSS